MLYVRPRSLYGGALFLLLTAARSSLVAAAAPASPLALIEPNDNTRAAGTLERGTLTLALRAAAGRWHPEGPGRPALEIEAFGEAGKPLTVPAPLIRVVEGTTIVASIRNDLDAPLVVHGLCARGGDACAPLRVAPHQIGETRFASGPAGTYHYWASSIGAPVPFRELAGAFVVDSASSLREPDRILVITEWSNLTPLQLRDIVTADEPTEVFVGMKPRLAFVINGLSWPATEKFAYDLGQRVRWRVINVSSQPHPLHLHGFYFEVNSLGDGQRDSLFDDAHRRHVVTQLLPSSGTMTMTWIPERAGNWLFHCHVMHHVSPERRLEAAAGADAGHGVDVHAHPGDAHDSSLGMAGMVIGVTVRDPHPAPASSLNEAPRRKLTLSIQPAKGPGPSIVLRRGEPVEITLVNRLSEATSIHWHGIELDSFYDGVHGWSGSGTRVAPMIEPGGRFTVRLTPPRAGTFIYHTHLHDYRQLSSGVYGPVVVTDADETFDPQTDHVIILGRDALTSDAASLLTEPESVVMNGERAPRFVWKAGVRHRVRLINITPDDVFSIALQTGSGPASWTPIAKDGAPVTAVDAVATTARQTIAVGETYDFAYQAPEGRGSAWLDVRTTGGKWQVQGHIITK